MEQQQRSLVFTAAVGLIILAIIVGSIYYLVKFIQARVSSSKQTQIQNEQIASGSGDVNVDGNGTASNSPLPNSSTRPNSAQNTASNKKSYDAGDFQLAYPNNWGVVKCSNGNNFEFDPQNSADSTIACDVATKPVTVVVADITGCEGDTTKIGNIDVIKSQVSEGSYTKYQWCTKTTPVLNITHRVSQGGERATSTQDFSKQIEEIISTLSVTRGS